MLYSGHNRIKDKMKRKVIRQGNGTLTVTLPKNWTKDIGLKGGDEVEVQEVERGILFSTDFHSKQKSISINIDHMERLSLAKVLIACFEQGFDSITLTFSKSKIKSWSHGNENLPDLVKFFVGRLIGFEVLSQTSASITIGNLSEKLTKFENILSRIFFLIEEYLQHLIESMKSGDYSDLKNSENRHDNITKLVALGLRMVSEDTTHSRADALNYFTILNYLDKITDFIRYAYKNTSSFGKKVSKETLNAAEKSFKYLETYRHFFYKFDYKAVNELDEMRGEIKNLIVKASRKGANADINSQLDGMVESLHGIVKSRIAIELSQANFKKTAV